MKHFKLFFNHLTISLAVSFLLLMGSVKSALAITYGTVDLELHPQVVNLTFDIDGVLSHRCSGTLLSPTVILTAGHCTDGATSGRVYPCTNMSPPTGVCTGYPATGGIPMTSLNTMPGFDSQVLLINDIGVVTIGSSLPGPYAQLPPFNGFLDDKMAFKDQLFTPVGYGFQSVKPNLQIEAVRYFATMRLKNNTKLGNSADGERRGNVLFFSNNQSQDNGGICFGDSGGPTFVGTDSLVIAGVNSIVSNLACKGSSGIYRVDTQDARAFINSFLP